MHLKRINLLPELNDIDVKTVIKMLCIENKPFYLDVIPDKNAEYGNCFLNVFAKIARESGAIIYGWHFCKHEYMVEAEFHGIWKSPQGQLIDITPSINPNLNKSLFVIDEARIFEGKQVDNFRLNITNNELVDDLIEVEQARFRFLNKDSRANILGRLDLSESEQRIWELIEFYATSLEQLYFNGWTIGTKCFCGTDLSYNECHRRIFKQVMLSI